MLISQHGASGMSLDSNGRTPMHYACATGNDQLVDAMIHAIAAAEIEDIDAVVGVVVRCSVFDKRMGWVCGLNWVGWVCGLNWVGWVCGLNCIPQLKA
jgi:hypothetical protein